MHERIDEIGLVVDKGRKQNNTRYEFGDEEKVTIYKQEENVGESNR
jgi:hypothetical protein